MHATAYLKWISLVLPTVHAQGFTFPAKQMIFLVGDLVNITWDVPAARFSLYEICATSIPLQSNSSNTHNYIWNATRDNYRESGCVFELEPLYRDGSWQAPNFTSPFFGVDMRFAGDPGPTDWNFGGSSSSSTTSIMATVVPTASPSSGILSSSTTTPVPAVTSSASASSTTSASAQSGLKPAQKTGIGVGVSLGALLLLLCALGLLLIRSRRRRANSKDRVMEQSDPIMKTDIKPPTTSTHRHISGTETLFSELSAQNYDDDSVHKSSSQRPISELMASPPRAELE